MQEIKITTTITINQKPYEVPNNTTVLQAIQTANQNPIKPDLGKNQNG
jgi:sulfur carrier protein ThiS